MVLPVVGGKPRPNPMTDPFGSTPTPSTPVLGGLATANNDNADRRGRKDRFGPKGPGTPSEQRAADKAKQEAATRNDAAQKPRWPVANKPLSARTETSFPYGHDAFGLRRGAIIRTHRDAANKSTFISNPKYRYTFNFLFNPETINFGNSSFAGVVPPEYKNTNDNLVPLFVGQESCNFSLLLDRTQEAYEEGLSTRGTLDDVEALYRVVNGDFGSSAGYISLAAVEIHFGPTTQNGRPIPMFPCYITSIDVTHTQFTPRMCPMRTTIQISAARLVGVGGNYGGTAAQSGGGNINVGNPLVSAGT